MKPKKASREELERRVRELEDGIEAYVERFFLRGKGPALVDGRVLVSTEDMRRLDYLNRLVGGDRIGSMLGQAVDTRGVGLVP